MQWMILWSSIAVACGLLIFFYFGHYKIYHTSTWGGLTFIYASICLYNALYRYLCAKKNVMPKGSSKFMIIIGSFGIFVCFPAFLLYLALGFHLHMGMGHDSYFVTIVWVYMTFKWALVCERVGAAQLRSVDYAKMKLFGDMTMVLFQLLNVVYLVLTFVYLNVEYNNIFIFCGCFMSGCSYLVVTRHVIATDANWKAQVVYQTIYTYIVAGCAAVFFYHPIVYAIDGETIDCLYEPSGMILFLMHSILSYVFIILKKPSAQLITEHDLERETLLHNNEEVPKYSVQGEQE